MDKLYLIFGVHNHQPVGNFDSVFLKAYEESYLPFFKTLAGFPKVSCNVHFTGPLLDWIFEKNKSELAEILKTLHKRKQIEFLSGGYYEPVISTIPEPDQLRQIELMNSFLKNKFDASPQGMWLAERVWEPSLSSVINKAKLKFTLVDDAHFRYAGITEEDIPGFYYTEDSARPIYVFPISKRLRYKIPFSKISETEKVLKNLKGRFPGKIFTIVDDGEKFGLWPHTYDWVYKKEWLKKFFFLLEKSSDWVETLTFSKALKNFSPEGIIYLPTASYDEMAEWVLLPQAYRLFKEAKSDIDKKGPEYTPFLRGGFFRNFFHKYPDINYMHKRMLNVSKKINKFKDYSRDKASFTNLFKSQCNCAYWHGVFGGFYLSHLRNAVYENLIRAEKSLINNKKNYLNLEQTDFDFDGKEEIVLKNEHLTLCLSPKRGASIEEISSNLLNFNFVNTFTRREENYHQKIKETVEQTQKEPASIHDIVKNKEEGLENYLIYDNYRKTCLIDHLIEKTSDLNRIAEDKSIISFVNTNYTHIIGRKLEEIKIRLEAENEKVNPVRELRPFSPPPALSASFSNGVKIKKTVTLKAGEPKFTVDYEVTAKDKKVLQNKFFAVEFNIFVLAVDNSFLRIDSSDWVPIKRETERDRAETLEIVDRVKQSRIKFFCKEAGVRVFPIYSVSSSESGFEKNLQQVSCFFIHKIEERINFSIEVEITDLGQKQP